MTPRQFRSFMRRCGLTYRDLRERWGLAFSSITKYRRDGEQLPGIIDDAAANWEREIVGFKTIMKKDAARQSRRAKR